MKSFGAVLFATAFLAGAAEAASNSKTWTGTAVVINAKTMTPSASTDWSISSQGMMTVSYKTTATLATGTMIDGDKQQVWWCALDMQGDSKTHCHVWAFHQEEEESNQTIEGKVLWSPTSTGLPTPESDYNAFYWFDNRMDLWTGDSYYEYEKKGTGAFKESWADAGDLNYKWGGASISGKVATGTLTKLYDATASAMLKKGKLFSGVIGAYYRTTDGSDTKFKKTSRKEMQVGIAAEGAGDAAASLYTTLGAIAVGVVALAF